MIGKSCILYIAVPNPSRSHIISFQQSNKTNILLLTDVLGNSIKKEFLFDARLLGTKLAVSICKGIDNNEVFLVENIMHYCRCNVDHMNLATKFSYIKTILEHPLVAATSFVLYLPCMWENKNAIDITHVPYEIQEIASFRLCDAYTKDDTRGRAREKIKIAPTHAQADARSQARAKAQAEAEAEAEARARAEAEAEAQEITKTKIKIKVREKIQVDDEEEEVFEIRPVTLADIYHLYSVQRGVLQYYDVACIPNYKTSIMMNSLFRCIKENQNIDLIEESDSDSDDGFAGNDRFKIKNIKVNMVCRRHKTFRKWVPISVVTA